MWVASDLVLEESPKWHLLKMVLEEVRKEMKATGEQEETEQAGGLTGRRVLVVVNDERTCYQLKQVPSPPLSVSVSLSLPLSLTLLLSLSLSPPLFLLLFV